MKVQIGQYSFTFTNFFEIITIYKDIFFHNEYAFKSKTDTPTIIDCGAHIGISVSYFKKLYPRASILAFEPNPVTFTLLKTNVENNHLSSVRLVNMALSDKSGKVNFYVSNGNKGAWSCGDSIAPNPWITKRTHRKIVVDAVKLSDYIKGSVDLLKLDVEGMEERVLSEIGPKLSLVNEIILEFHGNTHNKTNRFSHIFSLLKKHGFYCRVYHPYSLVKPIRREVAPETVNTMENSFLIVYAVNLYYI